MMNNPDVLAWVRKVPQLDVVQVTVQNMMYVGGGQLKVTAFGQQLDIGVQSSMAMPSARWRFALPTPGGLVGVAIDSLEPLLPESAMGMDLMPNEERLAVIRHVAEVLSVNESMPWMAALGEPCPMPSSEQGVTISFRVTNRAASRTCRVTLMLPNVHALTALARAWQRLTRTAPLPPWPVPVSFEVGSATLALAELVDTRAGDVILLPRVPSHQGQWVSMMRAGADRKPWARAYVEGDRIVVQSLDLESGSQPPSREGFVEGLSVELRFEIGRRTLALDALLGVGPGFVFELGAAPDTELVEIVVNGMVIGVGQLVLVGEAMGVRVTRMEAQQIARHRPKAIDRAAGDAAPASGNALARASALSE